MRIKYNNGDVTVWASAEDTYAWAHKPGARWPCSTLSGRRFAAVFDDNGLCDLTVDGRGAPDDIDGQELSCICADLLRDRLPESHPAWFVAVGQFQDGEVDA